MSTHQLFKSVPGLSLLCAVAALTASPVQAGAIGAPHITPSTTLGQYLWFSIDQMADGISNDSPMNGYASGFGVTSGRITLTLDASYDLSSFVLWNDVNLSNEGVRSFKLTFEDASGSNLGSTGVLTAVSLFAPQTYTFASAVTGVKTVQMDVLTSSLQIEIREVAFNGSVTAVPEAPSAALMLGGLVGVGAWLRRRSS